MKQKDKDKELLLRYISMALPYGVVIKITSDGGMLEVSHNMRLDAELLADLLHTEDDFKPYLRPMSSMTDEEDKKRIQLGIWRSSQTNGYEVTRISPDIPECYNSQAFQNALDFLLREHFDIFGLIPKGLAIEITGENNPYKKIKL